VRLEELGQLKNPMTSSILKPSTFRLVAWCLNQLRYRMPLSDSVEDGKWLDQLSDFSFSAPWIQ
jgi:hypothetical protein